MGNLIMCTSMEGKFHQNDVFFSEIYAFLGIDNVVVLLIYGFSLASNEHHQNLCTMALVMRSSSPSLDVLSIW